MVQTSSLVVVLTALVFFATVSLAAETCPNRCLRPKGRVVRQCRGALSTLCKVKKCPGRRGWKCTKLQQRGVKCEPVDEPSFAHCGQGPLCDLLEPLAADERSTEIGCKCMDAYSFTSENEVIGKGMNEEEFKCYVDCMKTVSCRRRVCTAEPASAGTCDKKIRIQSQNVRSKRNQRRCCQNCGFSYFLRSEPGLRDTFVCGST